MPYATLIVSQPGRETVRVELSDGVASIGRAEGNSIRLKYDRNVSRRHAEITLREDGYWLSDLTTRNGTTVNGSFVENEHKLVSGDVIGLGGTSTLQFSCETETTANKNVEPPALEKEEPSQSVSAGPQPEKSKLAVTALGIAGGVAVIAIFLGVLFVTGLLTSGKSQKLVSQNANTRSEATPLPTIDDGDEAPSPTPQSEPTTETVPDSGEDTKRLTADTGNAQILAAKISPKNYRFDPAFVALIGGYVNDYKSAGGYYGRARKYRDAIDKEFVNVQGLPPVFGYVMAMSRTRFLENGGDVWSLPNSIVKSERVGLSETDATGSTKVAASYIRALWDVFGREGFMYVVACYGMSLDEAGEVQQRLEAKDPTGEGRYDFWRMKNAGVVKGEQVERVARFFAAGIVIENPQQYSLNEPSISTLY
jgi:FHA domain-containing protein